MQGDLAMRKSQFAEQQIASALRQAAGRDFVVPLRAHLERPSQ